MLNVMTRVTPLQLGDLASESHGAGFIRRQLLSVVLRTRSWAAPHLLRQWVEDKNVC